MSPKQKWKGSNNLTAELKELGKGFTANIHPTTRPYLHFESYSNESKYHMANLPMNLIDLNDKIGCHKLFLKALDFNYDV